MAKSKAADADLAAFLQDVGHRDVSVAREAARARSDNEAAAKSLEGQIAAACPADGALNIPKGLDALRAALAQEARPEPLATDIEKLSAAVTSADAEVTSAREAEAKATGQRDGAVTALQKAEVALARLQGLANQAHAEVNRLSEALERAQAARSDDALAALIETAKAAEATSAGAHGLIAKEAEALNLADLKRKHDNHERRVATLASDRLTLVREIAQLEEQAKTQGAAGPASRLAEAEAREEDARHALDRLSEEAETLSLLAHTLKTAQEQAAQRFLRPVTQRVAPYIRQLLPNADLALAEDLTPANLTRNGRLEPAHDLSKGTQEQIAVLTRIAFADLLLAKGKPASLILDDALVFADDDRFEVMTEILTEAAQRMQVIILSCRASAYRHLEATRLTI